MDLAQFALKMYGRARDVPKNLNSAKQQAAGVVLQSVAEETPVDTGKAVSNWQVGFDNDQFEVLPAYAPGRGGSSRSENIRATIAAGTAKIATSRAGQVLRISNVIGYIKKLNDGSSAKAPAGFAERAVQRGRAVMKRAKVIKD